MDTIIGTILGGTAVLAVGAYFLKVVILVAKASKGQLKSDSRGIKALKFQEYNSIWSKFVVR